MPDSRNKELVDYLQKFNINERRQRQMMQLKAYDLGRVTPLQAIEAIVGIERIIFIGDQIKLARRNSNGG